ncbi:MAG: T9SS type A sorting domain-containing protein [Bacteroidia bacterium]
MTKKLLFASAFSLLSYVGFTQVTWDDFDNPGSIDYTFVNGALNQEFANPETAGINSSALCARYGRSTQTYDVIVIDPSGTLVIDDVSDYLSGTKKMSMKIFSPGVGITVQITLENKTAAQPTNYPTGRHSEYTVLTTTSNAWETIEFTFSNQPDNTVANTDVDRMVILFDPGSNNDQIFIFDDLMGPEFTDPCGSVTPDQTIGDDFECQRNVSYDFINGNLANETNPNSSGINTSTNVGKFTKWTTGVTDGAFGGSLDFPFENTTYKTANIMLYDPNAPQNFLVIFQDAANTNLIEVTFTTSSTADWQEFKMDLSSISPSTSIAKYVLLLNPATTTEDVIYYDNFKFTNDAVASITENNKFSLEFYPNPVKDNLTITSENRISSIKLYDLTGKLLIENYETKLSNVVDVSTLEKGVYLVSVSLENGNILTQKIVK